MATPVFPTSEPTPLPKHEPHSGPSAAGIFWTERRKARAALELAIERSAESETVVDGEASEAVELAVLVDDAPLTPRDRGTSE